MSAFDARHEVIIVPSAISDSWTLIHFIAYNIAAHVVFTLRVPHPFSIPNGYIDQIDWSKAEPMGVIAHGMKPIKGHTTGSSLRCGITQHTGCYEHIVIVSGRLGLFDTLKDYGLDLLWRKMDIALMEEIFEQRAYAREVWGKMRVTHSYTSSHNSDTHSPIGTDTPSRTVPSPDNVYGIQAFAFATPPYDDTASKPFTIVNHDFEITDFPTLPYADEANKGDTELDSAGERHGEDMMNVISGLGDDMEDDAQNDGNYSPF